LKVRIIISIILALSSRVLFAQTSYPVLQTVHSTDYQTWEPVKTYMVISKLVVDDTAFKLYNGDKLIGAISKGDCVVKKVSDRGIDYVSSTNDNSMNIIVRMYLDDNYTYTPIMILLIYRTNPDDKTKVDYFRMNLDPGAVK